MEGAGNTYDFGARIYDSRIGRFLTIDPQTRKAPDFSTYIYCFDNPNIYNDKSGKWPTPTHHLILELAFGVNSKCKISENDLKALMKGSDITDSPFHGPGLMGNQSDEMQHMHGMKPSKMSNIEAKKAADEFINEKINEFVITGDFQALGMAMHTAMDKTSPAHRDENGEPKVYNDPINHHNKEEPSKITSHDGKDGYITINDMNNRINVIAVKAVQDIYDEAMTKRAEFVKNMKESKDAIKNFKKLTKSKPQ